MMKIERAGFALPVTMGALVIVGLLVTAGFYVARQEVRIGVASKNASQAFYLAELGTNEVVAGWNGSAMGALGSWGQTSFADTLDYGHWAVNVTRMANRLYYMDATGTITEGGTVLGGAERRVGLLVRLFSTEISPPAALTTRGTTTVRGGAEVHGEDLDPSQWAGYCSNPEEDKPGIMTNDTSALGTAGGGEVTGDPKWVEDATIADSTFTQFGDTEWADLVALANLDVSSLGSNINSTGPALSGLTCDKAVKTNWGDPLFPTAPCGSYFPVIYHGGPSLRIQSGGFGQGILLVDGDLDLRGNFVFYGIIIVQGTFSTQGAGNRIVGAVMASNSDLDAQSVVGASVVTYSSCGVERAILENDNLTRARPLGMRSFVDLSNIYNY